jgi:hypothetical protein
VSAYRDPDLDGLADERDWDPDQRELAQYLRASSHPYAHVEPSPQFRQALQRRLMREAWEQASRPAPPWYRRFFTPQPLAATAAAVGAVMIVFTAFFFATAPRQHDQTNVAVVSPQQNAQLVSTVTPIELTFSEAMDTSSVQVDIQPRTDVLTDWQGNTLKITPVNGLAANTQYQVTVRAAKTAAQKPVVTSTIKPVKFNTGPAPTPVPSAGPTPTPPPTPILNQHPVAPIGALPGLWLRDGSGLVVIGSNGQLQQYPLQTGAISQKLADGATLAAVAPDGSVAWVGVGGQVTWRSAVITGIQPIGLGFRQGGALLIATSTDVETADQKRVAVLRDTASAVEFSPAGDRLAYLAPSGLHLLDLATGRDTQVGPAPNLGDWSPDDHHYAYPTDAGASVADAVTGSTGRLVDLPGVTGLTWSPGNQLLLSTTSALYLATYTDGSPVTAQKQQDGVFGQPEWAPSGSGQFSFRRNGSLWVATVRGALPGTITPATPNLSQDDLVTAFMNARKNQVGDPTTYLDAAAKDAFVRYTLVFNDPTATVSYRVLLSQPGRVVLRIVVARGQMPTVVEETLGFQQNGTGRLLVHSVSETPHLLFGNGPEILSVNVTANQVQVVFDSDLDPISAAQAGMVSIKGVNTQASFDPSKRTLTLTVLGGLTPGTMYDLTMSPSLQDVNQRHALPYDLQLIGPTS